MYGTVIQTGVLVLTVQAFLIALIGGLISLWLPHWMNVPEKFWIVFRTLMVWQCVFLGIGFVGRIFGFVLQAHQRYDVCNYGGIISFVVGLLGLWAGFELKWGLYSMLAGYVAGMFANNAYCAWMVIRFRFFPAKGHWGKPSGPVFREIFFFGADVFLLSIGQQLIAMAQVPVVSRTLGLESAAVWSVAVKVFMMAQQLVYRIFDFSYGALAEMMVREERERLKTRFRDVVVLTGSGAVGLGLILALCNQSFLHLWTHGRISWNPLNDLLMAVSFFVYASTRVHIGFVGITKQIGTLKYIYFLEGAAFVGLALVLAPRWSFPGVIVSGIVTDLVFSGIFGSQRTMTCLDVSVSDMLRHWMGRPLTLLATAGIVAFGIWWLTARYSPPVQLAMNAAFFGSILLVLFWKIGLPDDLRREAAQRLERRARIGIPA